MPSALGLNLGSDSLSADIDMGCLCLSLMYSLSILLLFLVFVDREVTKQTTVILNSFLTVIGSFVFVFFACRYIGLDVVAVSSHLVILQG